MCIFQQDRKSVVILNGAVKTLAQYLQQIVEVTNVRVAQDMLEVFLVRKIYGVFVKLHLFMEMAPISCQAVCCGVFS